MFIDRQPLKICDNWRTRSH